MQQNGGSSITKANQVCSVGSAIADRFVASHFEVRNSGPYEISRNGAVRLTLQFVPNVSDPATDLSLRGSVWSWVNPSSFMSLLKAANKASIAEALGPTGRFW